MVGSYTVNQTDISSTKTHTGDKKDGIVAPSQDQCAQWVELAKAGDKDSWDKLVEAYHTRIYHYLVSFMGNPHDAQDVAQDTFVKVYKKLYQHRSGSSFTAWIFTVAKRTALNHFRDKKVGEELADNIKSETHDPQEKALVADDTRLLWDHVETLKPNARQAMWLRYGDGLSIQEVADVLGKTSLYVRVLLHRAKADLIKKLKKYQ